MSATEIIAEIESLSAIERNALLAHLLSDRELREDLQDALVAPPRALGFLNSISRNEGGEVKREFRREKRAERIDPKLSKAQKEPDREWRFQKHRAALKMRTWNIPWS